MKGISVKKAYKILIVVIPIVIIYIATNMISICLFSSKDEKIKSDVAIILGASTDNGQVSPVYQERLNHGIELYREGYVKKLIVTGGMGKGNEQSDADAAKQYVIMQGIPEADILVEQKSTITQENLKYSKQIMGQNGYETAIIVSDPLHMKRSMLLAKDAGINAYSSPTPTTKYVSLKTQLPFLAREVFYYVGYKCFRILGAGF